MKRIYNKPAVKEIGTMVQSTLGASGTVADNGTQQEGGGNGTQANNTGFNNQSFNNQSFNNNGS